jgi:hypothetical protein
VLVVVPALLFVVRAPAHATEPSVEAQVVALTNSARTSHGLAPLGTSSTLTSIARSWSAHIAGVRSLVHNGSLGSEVHGWSMIGENLAMAFSATQAQQLWMASPGHRANILQPRFNRIGVGVTRTSDGALWITVDFEQVSGSTAAPAPTHDTAPAPSRHTAAAAPKPLSTRQAAAHRASRSAPRPALAAGATRPRAVDPASVVLPARQAARDAASDAGYVDAAPSHGTRVADGGDPPASAPVVAALAALVAAGALAAARFGRVDLRRVRR